MVRFLLCCCWLCSLIGGGEVKVDNTPAHSSIKTDANFVIVIPCYNYSLFLEKTLSSVANQTYPNFRVIILDDCSKDDTIAKAHQLVDQYGLTNKVQWRCNKRNYGALYNHYHAIHSCDPREIIVCLYGDDAFYDNKVLATLNKIYSNKEV